MKIASAADESALRPILPFSTLPTRSHPSVASQTASLLFGLLCVFRHTGATSNGKRLSRTTEHDHCQIRTIPPKRVPGLAGIKPPGASTWPPSGRTRPVALTVLRFAWRTAGKGQLRVFSCEYKVLILARVGVESAVGRIELEIMGPQVMAIHFLFAPLPSPNAITRDGAFLASCHGPPCTNRRSFRHFVHLLCTSLGASQEVLGAQRLRSASNGLSQPPQAAESRYVLPSFLSPYSGIAYGVARHSNLPSTPVPRQYDSFPAIVRPGSPWP
ncbi:hypothetical protein B0H13DRAFT_2323402 [Mycena leptocephala]|nr:hypothetical protein B0H13DRAFT_2323402 [Mycena leptocephala]